MEYKKIIRILDNKVFYILNDEFFCTSTFRIVRLLRDVRDFKNRFKIEN